MADATIILAWNDTLPTSYPTEAVDYDRTAGIDEARGRHFLVGPAAKDTLHCAYNEFFYVIDAVSGNILSSNFYPYRGNVYPVLHEAMFGFAYDKKRGRMYALNWHYPTVYPGLSIAGGPIQFARARR